MQPVAKLFVPELITCLTGTQSGLYLAAGTVSGTIYFWDIPSGQLLSKIQAQHRSINAITLAEDCSCLVAGAADGSLTVIKAEAFSPLSSFIFF